MIVVVLGAAAVTALARLLSSCRSGGTSGLAARAASGDAAVENGPGVEPGRLEHARRDRCARAGLADRHQRAAVEQSGLRGGRAVR